MERGRIGGGRDVQQEVVVEGGAGEVWRAGQDHILIGLVDKTSAGFRV